MGSGKVEKIIYNKYAVSDDGHVYSLDYNHTGKRKELKGYVDKDGYIIILIRGAPKEKIRRSRLVAECFIPNPDNLPQVNHKDTNRKNDAAYNLEWCDNTYNQQYASNCGSFNHVKQNVVQIDKLGSIIAEYDSICEASRKTGVNRVNITNCIGGKQKMAGGYIWKKGGDVNHGR